VIITERVFTVKDIVRSKKFCACNYVKQIVTEQDIIKLKCDSFSVP